MYPEACRCLREDLEASLAHLRVMPKHRLLVRTTNLAERAFEEERRRTKIIPHLVDEAAAVKLVFAVLLRVSTRWQRKRMFSAFEQKLLIQTRAEILGEQPARPEQPKPTPRRSAGVAA